MVTERKEDYCYQLEPRRKIESQSLKKDISQFIICKIRKIDIPQATLVSWKVKSSFCRYLLTFIDPYRHKVPLKLIFCLQTSVV